MAKLQICSVENCGNQILAKSLCERHYRRNRRYGDPLLGGTYHGEPLRFYEKAIKFDGKDCLIWPYGRSDFGYAMMHKDGIKGVVSRFVCIAVHGNPPTQKHEAAHSCGNGHLGCVSPNHLEWKTPRENHADKIIHGTSNRGTNNASCKLSGEAILEIISLKGLESQEKTAMRFGVNRSTISKIQLGNRWSWLSRKDPSKERSNAA